MRKGGAGRKLTGLSKIRVRYSLSPRYLDASAYCYLIFRGKIHLAATVATLLFVPTVFSLLHRGTANTEGAVARQPDGFTNA